MRKDAIVFLAAVLAATFAASNVASVSAALAKGTYTDHQNASGTVFINIEGHPAIVVDGLHYDYGDLGSGDVIRIWRYFNLPIGWTYLPVAIITDIPPRIALFQLLYAAYPTSIQLINDPSAIETVREGKSKNVHVVWKTELVVPDELWGPPGSKTLVPGITIPAGMLVFRGHGDIVSGSDSSGGPPPKPYSQAITWTGYYGDVTFVCPTWDFGGPVGVDEGNYRTGIHLDATVVTTVN